MSDSGTLVMRQQLRWAERAHESLFLPRSDGGWDYFPRGFHKPGFRVDDGLRNRIVAFRRGRTARGALLFVAFPFVPLVAEGVDALLPMLRPFTKPVTVVAIFTLIFVLAISYDRAIRTQIENLLKQNASPSERHVSAQERRLLKYRFLMPSFGRWLLTLLSSFCFVFVGLGLTLDRLQKPDLLSHLFGWGAMLLTFVAAWLAVLLLVRGVAAATHRLSSALANRAN